ncbi:MAG: DUF262 domain-containing protein [Myxococcaceae bacterium]
MSKTIPPRPEATAWSVDDVLRRAQAGELSIPVFQRSFRWRQDDILKLFDSIYRGYPVGDLLLWETEVANDAADILKRADRIPSPQRRFVVIDGQQRLTTIISVLLGDQRPEFRVAFDLSTQTFITIDKNKAPSPNQLPLVEVADTVRFLSWLRTADLTNSLINTSNEVVRAIRDYRLPIYVVRTNDEEAIREIFTRLNSTGRALKASEIFNAIHRGRGPDLRELSTELSGLGFGLIEEEWVLKTVAAVLAIDVTKNIAEALRNRPRKQVTAAMGRAKEAFAKAIDFLVSQGIPHVDLMPYKMPLVVLTKFFDVFRKPKKSTLNDLANWIWVGAWTGDHQRSDAPTMRGMLRMIDGDEGTSVDRLRRILTTPGGSFELRRHDFRSAWTKLTCVALASLRPLDFSGQQIDLSSLLTQHGAEALVRISSNGGAGTENRMFGDPSIDIQQELLKCRDVKVLTSHLLIDEAPSYFAKPDGDLFVLTSREYQLENLVTRFLRERCLRDD